MWDVIVIGSGIGGLAAAAELARRGRQVLVIEQHTVAGGLTQTFRRKDWTFAVADIAHPNWRASAIGIDRFWRDLGYGIGALALGAAAALGGRIESAFWFIAMLLSGAVHFRWGEATNPRLNPAR